MRRSASGTEHEKFPYRSAKASSRMPYEGTNGIRALLEPFRCRKRWEPIIENGHPIGLVDPVHGGAISRSNTAASFELSGAPLLTLHETAEETDAHLRLADRNRQIARHGLPSDRRQPALEPAPRTPVHAEAALWHHDAYMPKVGGRGLDMMFRTCTVQVNISIPPEADMVRKLRVSPRYCSLSPTRFFANSPFMDGRPTGFQSTRSAIWLDTDKTARHVALPFRRGVRL